MPDPAAPELRTARARLRALAAEDAVALRAILATDEVSRWWHPPGEEFPHDGDDETTRWVVELSGEVADAAPGAVVGMVQAWEQPDPDYDESGIDLFLAPSAQGRGLGREVVTAVRDWLVGIRGHHLVTIDPAAANAAAIACYTSCGFRPVGVLPGRERDTDGGGWHDTLLMQYSAPW